MDEIDFNSLLASAIGASATIVPAIVGKPTSGTAKVLTGTATTTAEVSPTTAAKAKSYWPWLAAGGALIVAVIVWLVTRRKP